jgi:hypothetical protein
MRTWKEFKRAKEIRNDEIIFGIIFSIIAGIAWGLILA